MDWEGAIGTNLLSAYFYPKGKPVERVVYSFLNEKRIRAKQKTPAMRVESNKLGE